ncbi:hypothetical protein [Mesorhizobium sp.]|uniref:hypothetical protein n=1 Tax=Mesorhizobium sp. TaxID=1871066 RepID=UPI000FE5C048|nr:hypothetical protein [Mesorhizobium sp.]RWM10115.1 MAG: hypothetical protein EOR71_07590 [Mesorhizobium sp.]
MSKHPIVPGLDLKTIRDLFVRHQKIRYRLLLATAIEYMKWPAEEADTFLRRLANAGYIEWCGKHNDSGNDWTLTDRGRRLAADDLGPRLSRQVADSIVAAIVARARTINADRDRLARVVELRLFGSALDAGREDYGDVDMEARIEIRKLPLDEVAHAHSVIAAKVPQSWRDSSFRNFRAEQEFDRRNAFTELSRGIKGLSLSKNATEELGCEYQRIYRFDLDVGQELLPDDAIVPRTTPAPGTALEVSATILPVQTVIPPLNLADADEKVRSDELRIEMSDIAYTEAVTWLGRTTSQGTPAPTDTRKVAAQRFAGAQFLFDEWRDEKLSGLELFQRAFDWASHYGLPISAADRSFTLRTYHGTRIASFHALMVKRVADRIDAGLVLRKQNRSSAWYSAGGSLQTSPRMIAAHHALAVAFGRMLDETRLTGQVDFRAKFDLTAIRRNSYPVLPDLSDISRGLRRVLPQVTFPEEVLAEARKRQQEYEVYLPLDREVEILVFLNEKTAKPTSWTSAKLGAEWQEEEPITIDDEGHETYGFLPGEEQLWEACEPFENRLRDSLNELPGCNLISIGYKAPIRE